MRMPSSIAIRALVENAKRTGVTFFGLTSKLSDIASPVNSGARRHFNQSTLDNVQRYLVDTSHIKIKKSMFGWVEIALPDGVLAPDVSTKALSKGEHLSVSFCSGLYEGAYAHPIQTHKGVKECYVVCGGYKVEYYKPLPAPYLPPYDLSLAEEYYAALCRAYVYRSKEFLQRHDGDKKFQFRVNNADRTLSYEAVAYLRTTDVKIITAQQTVRVGSDEIYCRKPLPETPFLSLDISRNARVSRFFLADKERAPINVKAENLSPADAKKTAEQLTALFAQALR